MVEISTQDSPPVTPSDVRDRLGQDPFGLHRHFFLRTKTTEQVSPDGLTTTTVTEYKCSCGVKVTG